MNYTVKDTHICFVTVGDIIIHEGRMVTVGRGDIRRDNFMGILVFGDSYQLGRQPAKKVLIHKATTN